MFKWVACLCATLYFTLLIFGAPPEGEEQVAAAPASPLLEVPEPKQAVAKIEPAVVTAEDTAPKAQIIEAAVTEIIPAVVTETLDKPTAAEQALTQKIGDIAKAVKPTRTAPAQVELASATPVVEAEPTPSNGVGEIWRVTGSTVNLRAGASTQFAVLGRTRRGESAEVMELLENGWAKVYVLESGVEAYMSADYLARDTQ